MTEVLVKFPLVSYRDCDDHLRIGYDIPGEDEDRSIDAALIAVRSGYGGNNSSKLVHVGNGAMFGAVWALIFMFGVTAIVGLVRLIAWLIS